MAHKWERWWRIWRKAEREGEWLRSWGDGSLVKTLAIQMFELRLGSLRAHINSSHLDPSNQKVETWGPKLARLGVLVSPRVN